MKLERGLRRWFLALAWYDLSIETTGPTKRSQIYKEAGFASFLCGIWKPTSWRTNSLKTCAGKRARPEKVGELLSTKHDLLADSLKRSNPPDDVKSISGELYVKAKALLNLQQTGNTTDAFLRDTMAPLLKSDTNTYKALKRDIFDE